MISNCWFGFRDLVKLCRIKNLEKVVNTTFFYVGKKLLPC